MKKTKQKILEKALELFNQFGVADVSIRQIAKEMGISHGNLIYHYKSKAEIIHGIHEQLFSQAVALNQSIDIGVFDISRLHEVTQVGFRVVHQFRFFFYDLLYIAQNIPGMREILVQIESVRSEMYRAVIDLSIENQLMRPAEYEEEYEELIKRIKIYSDHWITSAAIYEKLPAEEIVLSYSKLFMGHFYPYLTPKGKMEYLSD